MQERKNKSKKMSQLSIVGSFLLLLGFGIICYKVYNDYSNKLKEEQSINRFLKIIEEQEDISTNEIVENIETTTNYYYNYIAILEIPKIDLKKGLFSIDDINNNVDRNIEILSNSVMPNVENSLLALAGHSGSSKISYFNKLHRLENKDLVYIYYDNVKYIYEVSSIEKQVKDGAIEIKKSSNVNELILTTCDQQSNDKQLVVMATLIDKQPY